MPALPYSITISDEERAYLKSLNQLPRCKHSSAVSGSYVASHSTCLLHLLTQVQKRGMKVSLSLPLHIIE